MFSEFGRRKSVVSEIYSTLILVQKRGNVGYTYIDPCMLPILREGMRFQEGDNIC